MTGTGIGVRLLAGCTTGGMAVLCAQPTDVVKVRMQAQPSNAPKRYNGVMAAYRTIAVNEGIKGLWKGQCQITSILTVHMHVCTTFWQCLCCFANSNLVNNARL